MKRFMKWLAILAFVALALAAMSYAGARVTAGQIVGGNAPLSDRTIELAHKGVPWIRGSPRAWVFTYRQSRVPDVPWAVIVVSLRGDLLAMQPADLDLRIDAWERSRLP